LHPLLVFIREFPYAPVRTFQHIWIDDLAMYIQLLLPGKGTVLPRGFPAACPPRSQHARV